MSSQNYGNHSMMEAWERGTGKRNQSDFRNNITRRNVNIIESTSHFIKECPIVAYQPLLHLLTLRL